MRENIIYRAPRSSDDEIIRAATISGVMNFVQRNPKGFDLPVGEKGSLLSGGQVQSIAIARALLLNCPMVLLDEPSNQMDSNSEQHFIKHMKEYLHDREPCVYVLTNDIWFLF